MKRDERGTGTVLMLGVVAVLFALLVAGATLGRYLVALHVARTAADLAALAGAGAYQRDDPACGAARRVAAANGARLTGCDAVGDRTDFVVTVRTEVDVGRAGPGLPGAVPARGLAGPVRPDG